MFQPASLKGDSPTPIDERLRRKYLIFYLIIILLSFIPCSLFEYWYITIFWTETFMWLFFLLLPFNAFLLIYILQLSALIFSLLFLIIVKVIHSPKEGVFKRDIKDKEYKYWNLRNIIKKWPLYVTATNPFPWLKNRFMLRFFGTKIGSKTICDNGWISSEFVKIGKNVVMGMASTAISFGIEQDKFILRKIIIENDVGIGAKCILMPGTIMKRGSRLSAHSYTNYDAVLEESSVYRGHPAKLEKEK